MLSPRSLGLSSIGLAQYANFLYRLTSSPVASTHPILVPLFPHTSQALFHKQFLAPVGHHEMVETLRGIIQHEGWHRVGITIISHSMGTIVGSWLIKSLGELVRRCCIVDPGAYTHCLVAQSPPVRASRG